jgi:hypothetical protein
MARSTRGRAEKGCWTTKTLAKLAQEFETALEPLRACSDSHSGASRRRRSQIGDSIDSSPDPRAATSAVACDPVGEDLEVAGIG